MLNDFIYDNDYKIDKLDNVYYFWEHMLDRVYDSGEMTRESHEYYSCRGSLTKSEALKIYNTYHSWRSRNPTNVSRTMDKYESLWYFDWLTGGYKRTWIRIS